MGIRPKSTMENVLCPEISGTRYFVITGAYGYGHGILSHSLPGLTHTAYRLAVVSGWNPPRENQILVALHNRQSIQN